MATCLRCGASDAETGILLVRGTADRDIRFRRDGAGWFSLKDQVRAVACRACGHVELVLEGVRLPAGGTATSAGGADARIARQPG